MSNGRPAIPIEIRREVLFEARHHCAVCCNPLPLEQAHVIPWSESHECSVANLIALCANCHSRADGEKWGAQVLRKYKDDPCIYGTQGLNFVVPRQGAPSLKFVLGILNSSVINHLYATKFLNVAFKAEYLKDTPIPVTSTEKQKAVERLVDRILAAKQRDAMADVSALEREINQLVYALYGLTPEEIKIVESASLKTSEQKGAPK